MKKELNLSVEELSSSSTDEVSLHGWLLRSEQPAVATIVHFHGSDRNIAYAVKNVHWLKDHGFNVVVFDYRGYGKSKGVISQEALVEDSIAAVKYVQNRNDLGTKNIVLFGQSMGGQLAINAATQCDDSSLRLVVAEATYANPRYHISDKMAQFGPLWLVSWGAWLVTSSNLSGERAAHDLKVPLLLVHGSKDRGVRPYHSQRIFDVVSGEKDIWKIEGKGHLQVFKEATHRERLVKTVMENLNVVRNENGNEQPDAAPTAP